jgi:hypothetical protein
MEAGSVFLSYCGNNIYFAPGDFDLRICILVLVYR